MTWSLKEQSKEDCNIFIIKYVYVWLNYSGYGYVAHFDNMLMSEQKQ